MAYSESILTSMESYTQTNLLLISVHCALVEVVMITNGHINNYSKYSNFDDSLRSVILISSSLLLSHTYTYLQTVLL